MDEKEVTGTSDDAYIALGRFVSVFANLEFQLTVHLGLITGLEERSANLLLQGMSLKVKLQKLRIASKFAKPVFRDYAKLYRKFSEYNDFRNKLLHWSHIFSVDKAVFDITDPTRNVQKLLTAHRISIKPDEIMAIAEWITDALNFFYPFVLGRDDLIPEGLDIEALLNAAPPIPADQDTSLQMNI